jgi:uncharacterized protein (UPF0332 family)/predicted nucleotidyltransferase
MTPVQIRSSRIQPGQKAVCNSQLLTAKYSALEQFTQRLLASDAKDQIAKVILFGSVARGDARQDSDVDVLIFAFGDLRKLSEVCAEVSLDIVMESGEYIQALVYCIDDFSPPRSYFLYRVMRYGKEVYSMDEDELRNKEMKNYLSLAQEYLEMAETALANGKYRVAVDTAYNAAEACAKGLLLLKLPELPRSHSGLLAKFGELYIKHGPLPKKLGSNMNITLKLRSEARYDADGLISEGEAEGAIQVAEAVMKALEERMQSQLNEAP